MLTIVWIETKQTVLDTKFTIIITLNPADLESSIIKFMLIVFYLIFRVRRKYIPNKQVLDRLGSHIKVISANIS